MTEDHGHDDIRSPNLITIIFWMIVCGFGFWFPIFFCIKGYLYDAN